MKRIWKTLLSLALAATLLSGCVLSTVDELYCLPQRPQADDDLQKVIDSAMSGMSYCAPLSGENRQMIQPADLDGDGVDEYIVLAKDSAQQMLKLLVFYKLAVGYVLLDSIVSYGTAFDMVEFANVDDHPGDEIIIGRQMSDGTTRSVVVYRLEDGKMSKQMETVYAKLLCYDMDDDDRAEVMVLVPGSSGDPTGMIHLYRYSNGRINRCDEMQIASPPSIVHSMEVMALADKSKAVLLTSVEEDAQVLEVFSAQSGRLHYIHGPASVAKLNGYYVYPTDADGDGITELPRLVPMQSSPYNETKDSWILWYSLQPDGTQSDGMYTYYSFEGKWYLHMNSAWLHQLTVSRSDGICTFFTMDSEIVMTIYALTGANRKEQAMRLDGVVLGSSETVMFIAVLGPGAEGLGITAEQVKQLFYPIELKLYT